MLKTVTNQIAFINRLVLACLLASAIGCSTLGDSTDPEKMSAQALYKASKNAMNTADYETALEYLETLESRFPFGRYTQQAQLDIIYAYYKFDEPESAIAAADRFIKLYPKHPNVDYAYYMRGLSSFNKGMSSFDYLFDLDPVERDPGSAHEALNNFSGLISQFPESIYAADARQRAIYLHNNLAKHDLKVAEFYLDRAAYVAAARRASEVIQNYQRTAATRQALGILAKAYRALELHDLAADIERVEALNTVLNPLSNPLTDTPED
jgi:outer membrane protein assembly factor BamD